MPLEIRPTIFIGLGGTGCRIVQRLQDILKDKNADFWKNYSWFLKIDTPSRPERGIRNVNGDYIGLTTAGISGSTMVNALLNHPQTGEFFQSWWHHEPRTGKWESPPYAFDDGAGQIRKYGRLIFNYFSATRQVYGGNGIKAILGNKVDEYSSKIKDPRNIDPASLKYLDAMIFAGASGGSGSSLIVDLGFLVKSILSKYPGKLTGVILQEDIITNKASLDPIIVENMKRNKLSCLAELDFWNQPLTYKGINEYKAVWNSTPPKTTEFSQMPFDIITIVGSQNDRNFRLPEIEDYYDFVAHYFSYLFSSKNTDRWSQAINDMTLIFQPAENDNPKEARRYARIGFLRVRFPMEEIKKHMVNKLLAEALEQGFNHRHSLKKNGVKSSVEDAVSETWNDSKLNDIDKMFILEEKGKSVEHPVINDIDIFDGIKNIVEFRNHFYRIKEAIDEKYNNLEGEDFTNRWLEQFYKNVWAKLKSFADISLMENISVKNMWEYLHELLANIQKQQEYNNTSLEDAIAQLRKHEKLGINDNVWKDWEGNFKKVFGRGAIARDEAVKWLNTYSRLQFNKLLFGARRSLLKKSLEHVQNLHQCINRLIESANKLLDECKKKYSSSMIGIPEYNGIDRYLIRDLDELMEYRSEWFRRPTIKKYAFHIFRNLISGVYEKGVDLNYSGPDNAPSQARGFLSYLDEIRKMGVEDRRVRLDDKLDEFSTELKEMGARVFWKNTDYADKLNQMSVWDYIVDFAEKYTNQRKSITEVITDFFDTVRDQAMPFGKLNRLADTYGTPATMKLFIEHNHKSAERALKKKTKGQQNVDLLIKNILSPPTHTPMIEAKIEDSDPTQIVIYFVVSGYPLRVFEGLDSIDDIFNDPASLNNWVDRRFIGWLEKRKEILEKNERPTVDLAVCGLAVAWHDDGSRTPNSGIAWQKAGSRDKFKFSSTSETLAEDILDMFQELPAMKEYSTVKQNLEKVWKNVPPNKRENIIKEAAKFLTDEAKKRKTQRKEKLKAAAEAVLELVNSVDIISFPNL